MLIIYVIKTLHTTRPFANYNLSQQMFLARKTWIQKVVFSFTFICCDFRNSNNSYSTITTLRYALFTWRMSTFFCVSWPGGAPLKFVLKLPLQKCFIEAQKKKRCWRGTDARRGEETLYLKSVWGVIHYIPISNLPLLIPILLLKYDLSWVNLYLI